MEDKEPKEKANVEEDDDGFFKYVREAMGIKQKLTIINKKIQKKFLKEKPFPYKIKILGLKINNINNINTEEVEKEITKKIVYPSGITKVITKNGMMKF